MRVTFWGFRGAVDRLGCVYVDVDHQYFNDNNPPNGGGGPYAVDQRPAPATSGCAARTRSSYVRYRHLDNDLIRAARQQSFLGEAKNQIGIGSVFSDRKELLRIFGQSVRTDIDSRNAILSLLRLVAESADKPIQEVQFPAQDAGDGSGNVVIGPTALQAHGRRASSPPARTTRPARHGEVDDGQAQQAQPQAPAERGRAAWSATATRARTSRRRCRSSSAACRSTTRR